MLRSQMGFLRCLAQHCNFPASSSAAAATSNCPSSLLWASQRLALTGSAAAAAAADCSTSGQAYHSTAAGRSSSSSSSSSSSGPRAPNAPLADPWTPTSALIKRKTYQKRTRHLIQVLEDEQVQRLSGAKQLPEFRSGDVLEVTTVVPEADQQQYIYRGVCIARANKGPRSWFKIYNVFPDVGGFVQHLPLHMPDLVSVKVVGRLARARRSKLYHLLQDEGPKHIYQAAIAPPK